MNNSQEHTTGDMAATVAHTILCVLGLLRPLIFSNRITVRKKTG